MDIARRLHRAGLRHPKTVTIAITNRCNLSCRHCWPNSGPEERAPVVQKSRVLRLMESFADLGTEKFILTGGEPLTHPDWFEILSFAFERLEVEEVRLQTNAILITPAHVESFLQFKDRGLAIQTSLEGASPPPHDRVRGVGSFEQTHKGLRLLVDAGLAPNICITFTEMQHNFEEIPDLLKMVDETDVGEFVTGTMVACGRAAQSDILAPLTPDQYTWLLGCYQNDRAFQERYQRIGNIAALEWFSQKNSPADNCCTFIETPYVTAHGVLYPCVMLHADDSAVTGVYDQPLESAISLKISSWSGLQRIKRSRLSELEGCKACCHYLICGAGCMGRAYSAFGDFYAVEDRCKLRKAIYDCQPQEAGYLGSC